MRAAAIALAVLLLLPRPAWAEVRYEERTLRLTHYLPTGNRTYSGEWPATGTAACDWSMPIGTVIILDQGHIFRCNDRGRLGKSGWLDAFVWTASEGRELASIYGDYVTARVFYPD